MTVWRDEFGHERIIPMTLVAQLQQTNHKTAMRLLDATHAIGTQQIRSVNRPFRRLLCGKCSHPMFEYATERAAGGVEIHNACPECMEAADAQDPQETGVLDRADEW